MKKQIAIIVAGIALLAVTVPLFAHHAFDAEFDRTKPIKHEP